MANGHGGRRPGAGRKPKDIAEWRRKMEKVFASRISEDDAEQIVDRWVARAKAGDPASLWLIDRIFGKLRDESKVTHEQTGGVRVEVVYADAGPIGPAAPPPGPVADQGAG